jgi:hypothetical protein
MRRPFLRRAVRILSLLVAVALLVAWHRSFDGDYALGVQTRRVSASQGGRWEYRFTGVSVRRGLLGVGSVQERSGTTPAADFRYDLDGWTGGVNSSFWRDPVADATVGGFGVRRVNSKPAGNNLGYVGWVLVMPIWLVILLLCWPIGAGYVGVWREARQLSRAKQGLCPMCGYDLRGSNERCPECGAVRTETWPTTA